MKVDREQNCVIVKYKFRGIWTFYLWSHRVILQVSTNTKLSVIMTLPTKTITSVLKVLTYIITSITPCHITLASILVIITVNPS